jgi:hypothetical protein
MSSKYDDVRVAAFSFKPVVSNYSFDALRLVFQVRLSAPKKSFILIPRVVQSIVGPYRPDPDHPTPWISRWVPSLPGAMAIRGPCSQPANLGQLRKAYADIGSSKRSSCTAVPGCAPQIFDHASSGAREYS